MLKHFTTKELIFIALMSALIFIINVVIGSIVISITGIPLSNAFVTGITMGLGVLLIIKIVPKFGSLTLFLLIYSILSIPTSLGGAPGFWPKIPINTISGLLGDLFLLTARYRLWSLFLGFYIITTANISAFLFFLWLLALPAIQKTISIAHWLLLAYWILGTVGILIGMFIWNKLKDKRILLQISQ